MKIEILEIHRMQSLPEETPFWSVRMRVEDIFEVAFPVPFTVKKEDILVYLTQHKEDVLRDCKNIYVSKIAASTNIVDMFLDLCELKTKAGIP